MPTAAGFELFDHTADLGVRVWAPSRAGLIAPAAEGLYAAIGNVVAGGPDKPWRCEVAGDDAAWVLRDYLGELLVLFERDGRRVEGVDVEEFGAKRLVVTGRVRGVDVAASNLSREVKAVTYHELTVREIGGGGWEAVYIVDI